MTSLDGYYNSLDAIPADTYLLEESDPVKLDSLISKILDTTFIESEDREDCFSETNTSFFFWGHEASSYFCFDNIFDEIALGLRWHGLCHEAVQEEVFKILQQIGLFEFAERSRIISPWELSGGQQQRLLAGMIITRKPRFIFSFDSLIYVDHIDRFSLYDLVTTNTVSQNGTFVFITTDNSNLSNHNSSKRISIGEREIRIKNSFDDKTPKPQNIPPTNNRGLPQNDGSPRIMELQDLVFCYPNGQIGISVKDITFQGGRIYSVCGPNGGGKSSLMRLLCSNYRVSTKSTFRYESKHIKNPFKELVKNRKLTFTFQDPNLHITGGKLSSFLLPGCLDRTISDLNIADYLDEDILSLPLWVRQAAVFANALCANSEIIVLDEPLDGISYEIFGRSAIQLLNQKKLEGAIILVITHNQYLARQIADEYIWTSENKLKKIDLNCPDNTFDDSFQKWAKEGLK